MAGPETKQTYNQQNKVSEEEIEYVAELFEKSPEGGGGWKVL